MGITLSILGVVVRTHAANANELATRLAREPGTEVAANQGDGRLVIVLEDTAASYGPDAAPDSAAARLARIALLPDVLSTSLVYEYSGPDAPAPDAQTTNDFHDWRGQPGARSFHR